MTGGLRLADGRNLAGQELAPELMGYQNVLRNGATPLLNSNGQFVNFSGDVLTPVEVQAGGWFTPLYQERSDLRKERERLVTAAGFSTWKTGRASLNPFMTIFRRGWL